MSLIKYLGGLLLRLSELGNKSIESSTKSVLISLFEITRALRDSDSNERPFKGILEFVCSLIGSEHGSIWCYRDSKSFGDGEYLMLEASTLESESLYTKVVLPRDSGLAWKAVDSDDLVSIIPYSASLAVSNKEVGERYYSGKSVVLIRLEVDNELLGVICLAANKNNVQNIETLNYIGRIASINFHRFLLVREVSLLQKVSEAISSSFETVEAASSNVAARVSDTLLSYLSGIFFVDSATGVVALGDVWLDDLSSDSIFLLCAICQFVREEKTPQVRTLNLYSPDGGDLSFGEFPGNQLPVIAVPLLDHSDECFAVLLSVGRNRQLFGAKSPQPVHREDVNYMSQVALSIAPTIKALDHFSQVNRLNSELIETDKVREHELKAPLSSILHTAEFLKDNLGDLRKIGVKNRLDNIVEDIELVAFSIVDTNLLLRKVNFDEFEYLSPRDLLDDVKKFLMREVRKRSQLVVGKRLNSAETELSFVERMEVRLSGSAPNTMFHPHLIMRAFYNIGINAMKYGVSGGVLTIRLSETENMIRVSFVDNGLGIVDEPRDLILNGRRGSNVVGRPGHGIGLYVVSKVVDAHGGSLEFVSHKNPTRIDVMLPVIRNSSDRSDAVLPKHVIRRDRPMRRNR